MKKLNLLFIYINIFYFSHSPIHIFVIKKTIYKTTLMFPDGIVDTNKIRSNTPDK